MTHEVELKADHTVEKWPYECRCGAFGVETRRGDIKVAQQQVEAIIEQRE